ncbi:MAG: HAMP domain-containing histidine kinase [Gemmatimonadales bacterium]|nr:HAMP domain-containing histidine kinase [Gemmatimonadales bacterium]
MTIRTRLLAAFAAVAVLLGLPLAYGVGRLLEVRSIAMTLRSIDGEAFAALGELRAGLVEFDRNVRSYVVAPDPLFRAGLRDDLAQAGESAARLESVGYGGTDGPIAMWVDSLAGTTTTLEALVETGRSQEATDFLRGSVQPVLAAARATTGPIGDAITRSSARAAAEAQEISAAAITTAILGAVIALLLGTAVALGTTGALTKPVRRLRRAMASVARGAFVAPADLPYGQTDEIGHLSQSFRSMTEQLAELDRIRGEFLNVVSHDIKAPLNIINGCAELIEEDDEDALDAVQKEHLATIREHVRLLTERVNRLLNMGRLEARAYPVHPEPVAVAPAFEWIRHTFAPQARHLGIEFSVTLEPDLPPTIPVDPECLHSEIMGNLLSNAFKFTPRGGWVAVRVGADSQRDALHIAVADSGIGIPEKDIPFVFSKYYQAGRGASEGGVGLGLAIVRQVVEAHGGSVDVESRAGGGAIFHVVLPGVRRDRKREPALPAPEGGAVRLLHLEHRDGPDHANPSPNPRSVGGDSGSFRRWIAHRGGAMLRGVRPPRH